MWREAAREGRVGRRGREGMNVRGSGLFAGGGGGGRWLRDESS